MQKSFRGNRVVLAMLVLAIFIGAAPAWGSTYYLYSQWGGTWHDANKTLVDDSLMCWAASASNILDWGNWDTATYDTETKIFQEIKAHWTNGRGWQSWAWRWWLQGTPPPYNTYAHIDVPGGGDYFPTANFYSYYRSTSGAYEIASMDQWMHIGYGISLVIGNASGASHAITAWGFDSALVNGKTNYTALYVTDSDDSVTALKKMNLAYNTTNGWYFTSGYTNWKINGVYAFARNNGITSSDVSSLEISPAAAAPIMPTWSFVVTGLLLLFILQRRRKFSL